MQGRPAVASLGRARRIGLVWAVLICSGLITTACDESSPTSPTTVATTPAETMVESFSGTIALGGASEHNFVISQIGPANMTVTSLAPLATLTVGLGIGTVTDAVCTLFAEDRSVRVGETLRATDLIPGNYCVRIFDVGNIFEGQSVDYGVDVDHS